MSRELVWMRSITATRNLGGGYHYIRIRSFHSGTDAELTEALASLANEMRPTGLILDLRYNSGGLLTAAISVADRFLTSGAIVRLERRYPAFNTTYFAKEQGTWGDFPIVVPINHGTAAGAELVAGALGQHGRARTVGRETFGKGTLQTLVLLGDNRALKLTTARMYGPAGLSISAGLKPDIKEMADMDPWADPASDAVVLKAVEALDAQRVAPVPQ